MALQRMGRPIGSKDSRPRKPKFSVRTPSPEIASDSLTPFTAVRNCEVRQHFYAPQRNLEVHARPTISDQVPHDSVAPRRLFSLLQPESSSAALFDDRLLIEDEREAQGASIDDKLHAWAQCGSRFTAARRPAAGAAHDFFCKPSRRSRFAIVHLCGGWRFCRPYLDTLPDAGGLSLSALLNGERWGKGGRRPTERERVPRC